MADRTTEGVLVAIDKLGTGITYTTLAEVTSIDGPNGTVSALDKTVLADSVRKFRPGLYDPGEISLDLYFDPNDVEHKWLESRLSDRSTDSYRITFPVDGDDPAVTFTFPGFLTEFSITNGAVDDFITSSVKIKLSEKGVWAVVS